MTRYADLAREACDGRGAIQKREELADLLGIVEGLAPVVIVEIGSLVGGTLWAWRRVAPHAAIFAIDLPGGAGGIEGLSWDPHGAEVIAADSHHPATLAELRRLLAGRPVDFLFIDGDHSHNGVSADFEMYGPLVRPGGLVAFHDICGHPGGQDPTGGAVEVDAFWAGLRHHWRTGEIVHPPDAWGGIGLLWAEETWQPA